MRIFILPILILLTSCTSSEVRENLGLSRNAPDEFRVVSRPPLSMPKEFNLLPPSVGVKSSNVDKQAKVIITGRRAAIENSNISAAENAILEHAGAANADIKIKQKLQEEAWKKQDIEPSILDRITKTFTGDTVEIIDANAEKARIAKNIEQGKPINVDATETKVKNRLKIDALEK